MRETSGLLLERTATFALLDAALEAARLASSRLVVVEGPAGIGKSAVLAEARLRADEAGMRVLYARGSELETAFSYGVVRQLFEPIVREADSRSRRELLDGAAAWAAPLFEHGELRPAQADKDATFAFMHGLYWLAANLADSRPLVIAIDDLHWADDASLKWFSYLGRRLEAIRVCAFAAVRPHADEDPVLAELLADAAVTVERLSELSSSAAAELVRASISEEADDEFCRACHQVSGGNPLWLHELLRTAAADGLAPIAASAHAVARIAPDAVSRSVKARLARLPAAAVSVARAVAVLGDGADESHVAQLAAVERRDLRGLTAALARVDLLRVDPPLRFVHPVVHNAVYRSVPADQQPLNHARAAAILETAGAPAAAISAQLLRTLPQSVPDAAMRLRETGRQAAAEGAAESAATYLVRALEEPLADADRGDVLLELAESELMLGKATTAERLREALALLTDPARRSFAYSTLARALLLRGLDLEALGVLREALGDPSVAGGDLGRRLEADLIAIALRRPETQADVRRRLESLELTGSEGVGAKLLLGLRAYHDATQARNRDRALADAERALAAGSATTDVANGPAGHVLLYTDQLDELRRIVEPVLVEARSRGAVFTFADASGWRARIGFLSGALIDAEADARSAIEATPGQLLLWTPFVYGFLVDVLIERGALEEAAEALTTAQDLHGPLSEDFSSAALRRARAALAAAGGDHKAALADFLAVGEFLTAVGNINPATSWSWRSGAALAQHALGAKTEAIELAREEATIAHAWGAPRILGRALRILGTIEGGNEGIEHIRQAAGLLEGSPARLEYAHALTDLGAALRRANRRTAARECLRQALQHAQEMGAMMLAERAHEELLATGARPRRLMLSGVDALTPSERRVAAMAAEGLSNREIAQALFVALRTVETHLSNVFQKLGVSSRTQLATALAKRDSAAVAARST